MPSVFPDLYEVGMSHLGMKILYGLFNEQEDVWCERVFAPDTDMEALNAGAGIPLFGLEAENLSGNLTLWALPLQYELSYTGVLNMLDLAGSAPRRRTGEMIARWWWAGALCLQSGAAGGLF